MAGGVHMANVQDVANFFIEIGQAQAENGSGDPVTPLQLEKLLYFAQGWHLARFGKPLFDDDFKAWTYGLVIPDLYHKYKVYGRNGIMREGFPCAAERFTPDEYELLLDVAREYMRYSTSGLVQLSHEKGAPWDMTDNNGTIPKEAIKEYFLELEPLPSFDDFLDGYPVEVL